VIATTARPRCRTSHRATRGIAPSELTMWRGRVCLWPPHGVDATASVTRLGGFGARAQAKAISRKMSRTAVSGSRSRVPRVRRQGRRGPASGRCRRRAVQCRRTQSPAFADDDQEGGGRGARYAHPPLRSPVGSADGSAPLTRPPGPCFRGLATGSLLPRQDWTRTYLLRFEWPAVRKLLMSLTLPKGGNAPLPMGRCGVTITAPGAAIDVCAVFLSQDRKVRSDDDLGLLQPPCAGRRCPQWPDHSGGSVGDVLCWRSFHRLVNTRVDRCCPP
jgi:hypothetical protein